MADAGGGDVQWQPSSFPTTGPFCDVVMKGGVTSGTVYPLAICRLASRYVFRSIGGTSVGAVAAVLTAAAEYRRRHGSGDGFTALAEIPQLLTRPGYLLGLFQADPAARPLLDVALQLIGNASFGAKFFRFGVRLVRWYVPVWLLCFAAAAGLTWYVSADVRSARFAVGTFLVGLALSTVALPFVYLAHNVLVLNRSGFGWCHGHRDSSPAEDPFGDDPAPLTDWLAAHVDAGAGVAERQKPLTFGDLAAAPTPELQPAEPDTGVQLAMITTCLTIGRPYRIPFDPEQTPDAADPRTDGDTDPCRRRPGFYFVLDELRPYFPKRIIDHLSDDGVAPVSAKYSAEKEYRRFPFAADLPVVVAARMSLSFPVLLCAVPLYALGANDGLQRVWFSDGGLTSNFPVHFFDSPIPRWPTFAIDLLGGEPQAKKKQKRHGRGYEAHDVFLEDTLPEGRIEPWDKLDKGYTHGNVVAFFGAIVDTIRTWNDVTLTALRPNRQRTVGIRLASDEGGLNLNMPPAKIEDLIALGERAGAVILREFPGGESEAWKEHRWTRYRQAIHAYDAWLDEFARAYAPYDAQTTYDTLIRTEYPGGQRRADAAADATTDIATSKTRWATSANGAPDFRAVSVLPPAELVVRPPL